MFLYCNHQVHRLFDHPVCIFFIVNIEISNLFTVLFNPLLCPDDGYPFVAETYSVGLDEYMFC
jgi:uncharacterized protein (DUF2062 family)